MWLARPWTATEQGEGQVGAAQGVPRPEHYIHQSRRNGKAWVRNGKAWARAARVLYIR